MFFNSLQKKKEWEEMRGNYYSLWIVIFFSNVRKYIIHRRSLVTIHTLREHVGNILNHTLYRNAFLDITESNFHYIFMLTVAKVVIQKIYNNFFEIVFFLILFLSFKNDFWFLNFLFWNFKFKKNNDKN